MRPATLAKCAAFLRQSGVLAAELKVQPITAETLQNDNGKVTSYRLTRNFEVPSARRRSRARSSAAHSCSRRSPDPGAALQYVYTTLASLHPDLLAQAPKDALERALT
jgi:hypothetical protein